MFPSSQSAFGTTPISVKGSAIRMARKLRVQFPGAVYHVMNRGDHREPIFLCDKDRELFLQPLGKTGWQVQASCLMPNHFSPRS